MFSKGYCTTWSWYPSVCCEDLPPSPPLDDLQQKELLDLLDDRKTEKSLLSQVMGRISSGTINQGNFLKVMEHYTNT